MKIEQLASLCQCAVVLVLLMFLTGCNAPATSITPSITMITPSQATAAPTLMLETPTPSPMPATTTPSPTYTPAPPTLTPAPTLTAEEERAFVRKMLATNGGCELPCWWGITPGETTWQEVRHRLGFYYGGQGILRPGGVRYHEVHYGDLRYPYPPPYGYYIDIGFTEEDGVVQSIQVSGEIVQHTTPDRFAQDWRRYSLDQVLTRYGMPSQVRVHMAPPMEQGATPEYVLTVVYDDRGFWISYGGVAVYGEPKMRACPAFNQVNRVILGLQSPRASRPIVQPDPEGYDRSLVEATGISLEKFYNTFKNADSRACLESLPTLPKP